MIPYTSSGVGLSNAAAPTSPKANDSALTTKSASGDLTHAAKDFESILLGQWMQAAETSFASVPGSEDDTSNEDDQLKSLGTQRLATALTERGGVGIARLVSQALAHEQTGRTAELPAGTLTSLQSPASLISGSAKAPSSLTRNLP